MTEITEKKIKKLKNNKYVVDYYECEYNIDGFNTIKITRRVCELYEMTSTDKLEFIGSSDKLEFIGSVKKKVSVEVE